MGLLRTPTAGSREEERRERTCEASKEAAGKGALGESNSECEDELMAISVAVKDVSCAGESVNAVIKEV